MLKKLGFKFFVDQSGKYMVKLPEKSLEPKLRLISRCLLIFESNFKILYILNILDRIKKISINLKEIPSSVLKELFTLAREPTGNELLNLLKHHKNLVKTEKTTLLIKSKLYMAYYKFFKEFTMTKTNEENDFVQIQFDTEIFNLEIFVTKT